LSRLENTTHPEEPQSGAAEYSLVILDVTPPNSTTVIPYPDPVACQKVTSPDFEHDCSPIANIATKENCNIFFLSKE